MACSASVALGGCDTRPQTVRVGKVLIDAPPSAELSAEVRAVLQSRIRGLLEEDNSVELRGDGGAEVLRVRIGDAADVEAVGLHRAVQVTLRTEQEVRAYEAVGVGSADTGMAASVMEAFEQAWRVVGRQRLLQASKEEVVLAALHEGDPQVRGFAIGELGRRRSRAAVEPLCERLASEQEGELVLRAVGALVAIGDAQAVDPLIELSRRRDARFVMQVVFAVGAIGGRSAEGFLVTMASGHPNPAVQEAAKDALSEMASRAQKRRAAPAGP